jgi:hypothetical protein
MGKQDLLDDGNNKTIVGWIEEWIKKNHIKN